MILIPKKKSVDLTSKPKEKTKITKKKNTVSKYKYEVGDNNLIYISHVHEKQHGQECRVLERHRKHINHYYKIQFQDESIIDTSESSLMTKEEYEEYLLEIEEKKSVMNNESNDDIIYDNYGNYDATLNPIAFYEMRCHECRYEDRCVYKNKYNYKALKKY